jgi:hypothetical protein
MYQRFASNMPPIIIKIPGGEYLRRRESQTVGCLHLPDLLAFDGLRDRAQVSMIRSPTLSCAIWKHGHNGARTLYLRKHMDWRQSGVVSRARAIRRYYSRTVESLSDDLRVPLQGTTLLMWQVLDASMQAIFCSPNPSRLLAGRTF